jgi:hypothetical protein
MRDSIIRRNRSWKSNSYKSTIRPRHNLFTFSDFFAFVYFSRFFFEKRIALLADFKEICAGSTCLFDLCKDFLAYIGGGFEFCQGIGIGEGVVLGNTLATALKD